MSDLLAARTQMAVSLGFHIVFAAAGMTLPALMAAAEWRWLRTGDPADLRLAKIWAKGAAVLFAVGAVSGTVLSFELGLLWPRFMELAGPVVALPFALEGAAFFLEAIFLGVYLYGWDRVPPRAHWLAGLGVLFSGLASGAFVVTANGWMNSPAGFSLERGRAVDIRPWEAMWNAAAASEILHMTLAAFVSIGWLAAGIHAFLLLRRDSRLHRRALGLCLWMGGAAALLQPLSGDYSARTVARLQPLKLAAMEGHEQTMRAAPLVLGPIKVPKALSLLAFHDPDAEVKGLDSAPPGDRPPSPVVKAAFRLMVGCGLILAALSLLAALLARADGGVPVRRWFLRLVVAASPLGCVALEAGWTVTEVGRQPWIIYGVLRVKDALTPMPGLVWSLAGTVALYLLLSAVVAATLRSLVLEARDEP